MATPLRSSPVLIIRGWAPGARRAGRRGDRFFGLPIVAEHPPSTADDERLAWKHRQPFDATRRGIKEDEVLDPDAGFALNVDPRLDREDRRRWQRHIRCEARERRCLVGR